MIGLTRSHCPMWYAFRVVDTVYWTSTYVCVYAVDCSAPRVCWLGEEKEVCVYKRMDWQNIGCHGEVRYTTPNHCNNTFPWNFSDSSISCTFTSIWNINKKKLPENIQVERVTETTQKQVDLHFSYVKSCPFFFFKKRKSYSAFPYTKQCLCGMDVLPRPSFFFIGFMLILVYVHMLDGV